MAALSAAIFFAVENGLWAVYNLGYVDTEALKLKEEEPS